jgi:hypothetical protein
MKPLVSRVTMKKICTRDFYWKSVHSQDHESNIQIQRKIVRNYGEHYKDKAMM